MSSEKGSPQLIFLEQLNGRRQVLIGEPIEVKAKVYFLFQLNARSPGQIRSR